MPTHLLKCLTEAGLGSRRKLADAIRQGRVQVNGIVAENFRQAINPQEDSVVLDGQRVSLARPQTICLLLHKPRGVICTVSDKRGRQTVLDILPGRYLNSPIAIGLSPEYNQSRSSGGFSP